MAEPTGAAEAQGASAAPLQGSTEPVQGTASQGQGPAEQRGEAAVDWEAKVTQLEKDNRAYRAQLKAIESERTAKQASEQTEVERLTARLQDLEQQLATQTRERQEQSLRLATVTQATRLGYRNPDLAYRLLDANAVDYGPDGTPRNLEKLLTDLAKSEPYLLAQTDFGGGPRGTAAKGDDMNALLRSAAQR